MFDAEFSFLNMLTSLESTLKIDYTGDDRVSDVLDNAVKALESFYACDFDKDVFSLRAENQLYADNLNMFLKDVKQCLAEMSLFNQLKLFHKNIAFNLSDINYLGSSKQLLLTSLRYLQDQAEQQRKREDVIKPLTAALNNVPQCQPKRLFVIMLMFDRLGIQEGVAITAQLLYIGGLS